MINSEREFELEPERERYRREAIGAFAHEIRTPLTSIRMVLELARRLGSDGQMTLDDELAAMLGASVDDLQRLADDLQETSRLERGKVALSPGPCDLRAAVEAARELLAPKIQLEGMEPASIEGPWDVGHLVRAIEGFADSANRVGSGSGVVLLTSEQRPHEVCLAFNSGEPGGEERAIAADAGFGFFRSRQFVLAMGGRVECERGERYTRFRVTLPLIEDRGYPLQCQ